MSDNILKVEGIVKSFGNVEVLKNISFELKKGQVLASKMGKNHCIDRED